MMSDLALVLGAFTLISASSLVTMFSGSRRVTLMTSIRLFSCFITCSIVLSSPLTIIVILANPSSSAGPTEMLSMLKPLHLKRFETLYNTPGLCSTIVEIM